MKFLKQFAGWVTDSEHNVFLRARITLTAWYTLGIILIMGIFSLLLYLSLAHNLYDTLQDTVRSVAELRSIYGDATDQLQNMIMIADGAGILLIILLSYFLAGRTLRPIQKALDDQKRFSADASHELRTPLAIIQSESEVILRQQNAPIEAYQATIRSTLEEVTRMKKLTEQLLDIARSDHSRKNIALFSLSQSVEQVLEAIKPTLEKNHITLKTDIQSEVMMEGISNLITHAIQNVFQNSANYTQNGGTVHIALQTNKDEATIRVTDTGIGIAKDDLPHIFERFYRASNSRDYKHDGAGLGLAIVQQIIRDHRGSITLESDLGKGTTAIITLPIKAA